MWLVCSFPRSTDAVCNLCETWKYVRYWRRKLEKNIRKGCQEMGAVVSGRGLKDSSLQNCSTKEYRKSGTTDIASDRSRCMLHQELGNPEEFSIKTYGGGNIKKLQRPALSVAVREFSFDEHTNIKKSPNASTSSTPSRVHFSPRHDTLRIGNFTINKLGLRLGEHKSIPNSLLLQGKSDFIVIGMLGTGTSSSVIEALHMPTLTVVALKMLSIYEPGDLQQIESELGVLLKNLAELRQIYSILGNSSGDVSCVEDMVPCDIECESKECESPQAIKVQPTARDYETVCACPQLLAMFDAFLDPLNGMVNLVVEYMDGGSLEDVVQNGGCQNEYVLADIISQVLNGVTFLHQQKQIHRDIKPSNILLSYSGMVKLADFGISKAMDINDGNSVVEHKFVGTMRYMAPERISKAPYGYAADIWSIGLTMLAVVFGRYPLGPVNGEIDGYWDLLSHICDEDIPLPSGSDFSQELIDLLGSCLVNDPALRISLKSLSNHVFLVKSHECKSVSEGAGVCAFDCAVDFERVNHLSTVLEKVQHKYMQNNMLLSHSYSSSGCSSENLSIDSRCSNNYKSRKAYKLPSFEDQQWAHLAHQMHISTETVIATAKDIISPEFISCPANT